MAELAAERRSMKARKIGSVLQCCKQGRLKEILELAQNVKGGFSQSNLSKIQTQIKDELGHEICLKLKNGKEYKWLVFHPAKLVQYLSRHSSNFRGAYERALAAKPATPQTPWKCIVGFDEFTPGSRNRPMNHRKVMVVNMSFAELGDEVLDCDDSWLTPIVVRTTLLKHVQGGWSAMAKEFFRLLLFADEGGLMTSGMIVPDVGVVFGKLYKILGDGDGFRLLMDWRGARALRPCLKCTNTVAKNSDLIGPGTIDITCSDTSLFKPAKAGYWEVAGIRHMCSMSVCSNR